jgi:hypothetical protein
MAVGQRPNKDNERLYSGVRMFAFTWFTGSISISFRVRSTITIELYVTGVLRAFHCVRVWLYTYLHGTFYTHIGFMALQSPVSPDVQLHPATHQCTGMCLHSGALLQRQRNELLSVPSASYQKAHYLDIVSTLANSIATFLVFGSTSDLTFVLSSLLLCITCFPWTIRVPTFFFLLPFHHLLWHIPILVHPFHSLLLPRGSSASSG